MDRDCLLPLALLFFLLGQVGLRLARRGPRTNLDHVRGLLGSFEVESYRVPRVLEDGTVGTRILIYGEPGDPFDTFAIDFAADGSYAAYRVEPQETPA